MTFSEEEMTAAGFAKTVAQLPHVIASYELVRKDGRTVTFTNAGKEKLIHSATEFRAERPLRMLHHYRLTAPGDLQKLAAGTLAPFYSAK